MITDYVNVQVYAKTDVMMMAHAYAQTHAQMGAMTMDLAFVQIVHPNQAVILPLEFVNARVHAPMDAMTMDHAFNPQTV